MRERARLGMALLLLTDAIFFFFLVLAFVYFRHGSLPAAAASLHPRVTGIYTVCLLLSSFCVWRASASTRPRLWLAVTIALGVAFLLGQGSEYLRVLRNTVAISQGLFATTFFTIAAIHSLHVLIGILLLAILLAVNESKATRVIAMYWHFVAAVWLAIFSTLYLWTFL